MRAPPPVEFNSAPSRAWRAALCLLVGACVAVPFAWALPYLRDRDNTLVQGALALGLAAVAVAASWRASRRDARHERTLRWDGADWVLLGGEGRREQRGDVALMLDLGPWMLVRFTRNEGSGPVPGPDPLSVGPAMKQGSGPVSGPDPLSPEPVTWLPLAAGGDAARWAALRGALWNWRSGPGEAR